MFNLQKFINENVIFRKESMFKKDLIDNDNELKKALNNKSVLVIGGAGSIGSSYIKALLHYSPKSLVVVDINENALAELTRDIRSSFPELNLPEEYIPYPMDFNSEVFQKMFRRRKGFDIVANFSAHKHVRSEKDIFSVEALLTNNVFNANSLLKLLSEFPPEVYFCVSTDKAANPVNIMGASKRIMEDLIFSYSDKFSVKTARFANVAFSNGSLPAGFITRISKLQPISAPDDVKRYFVSPEESGQICLLATVLGKNREIFFPKLNEVQMVKFNEIAERLIQDMGYEILHCNSEEEAKIRSLDLQKGSKKYPVYFSKSNTSGEKQYEEFYIEGEATDFDRLISLGVITSKEMPESEKLAKNINELKMAFDNSDVTKEEIVSLMKKIIPGFEHIETGVSLDSKM